MALLREMLCWFLIGITPAVQNHTCACSVRKKNCGGRVHILTAEVPLPPKTSIHGVTKNKVPLNKMLAGAMMDPEFYRHATAGQMHSLSVAGTEDVPVKIVGATVIERRDLSSSHD